MNIYTSTLIFKSIVFSTEKIFWSLFKKLGQPDLGPQESNPKSKSIQTLNKVNMNQIQPAKKTIVNWAQTAFWIEFE